MKDQIFAFKLSKKHRETLEHIAQNERRSKGSVICNLIEDYAKSNGMEEKRKKTKYGKTKRLMSNYK